jgi:hypothetical protein
MSIVNASQHFSIILTHIHPTDKAMRDSGPTTIKVEEDAKPKPITIERKTIDAPSNIATQQSQQSQPTQPTQPPRSQPTQPQTPQSSQPQQQPNKGDGSLTRQVNTSQYSLSLLSELLFYHHHHYLGQCSSS